MVDDILKDHIEKMEQRIARFNEIKNEDIDAKFLFEQFKELLGGLDYILNIAPLHIVRELLREHIHEQASEIIHNLKRNDVLTMRYFMERYSSILIRLMHGVENTLSDTYEIDKSALTVKVESQGIAFICPTCEADADYKRRAVPMMVSLK